MAGQPTASGGYGQLHSGPGAGGCGGGTHPTSTRRRTELVQVRLAEAETAYQAAEERYTESEWLWQQAEDNVHDTSLDLAAWRQTVAQLESEYQTEGRSPTAHCKLARARRKLNTYLKRLPRRQAQQARAQRRLDRHQRETPTSGRRR